MGKISLTVWERIMLPDFYPLTTNFHEAVVVRDLQKKVEFTQKEIIALGIKQVGSQTTWEKEKETVLEIGLTGLEATMIKEGFERLDKMKKIPPTVRFVALCEKVKALQEEK